MTMITIDPKEYPHLHLCPECGTDDTRFHQGTNSEGVSYYYRSCDYCGAEWITPSEKTAKEHGVITVGRQ